jgi:T5SS/PEP-CTERM-associated repeat protein
MRSIYKFCFAVLASAFLTLQSQAALSPVGDYGPAIDPLGYGVPGQPANAGAVTIGRTDVGGLFINQQFEPGPLISTGDGILGRDFGSYGAVDMTDFFSDWLMAGDLIIGQAGTGTLDVKDSAKVQVGNNDYDFDNIALRLPTSAAPPTVVGPT